MCVCVSVYVRVSACVFACICVIVGDEEYINNGEYIRYDN